MRANRFSTNNFNVCTELYTLKRLPDTPTVKMSLSWMAFEAFAATSLHRASTTSFWVEQTSTFNEVAMMRKWVLRTGYESVILIIHDRFLCKYSYFVACGNSDNNKDCDRLFLPSRNNFVLTRSSRLEPWLGFLACGWRGLLLVGGYHTDAAVTCPWILQTHSKKITTIILNRQLFRQADTDILHLSFPFKLGIRWLARIRTACLPPDSRGPVTSLTGVMKWWLNGLNPVR